jgi:hypothetical protein
LAAEGDFPAFLRKTGREFFAEESNLNLLTLSQLRSAALLADCGNQFDVKVTAMILALWPANLILMGTRVQRR